jgi:signal transduction histidine kinase
LFVDAFVWNMASLLEALSGPPFWGWLDHSASPLTAPLALDFVLAFVGRKREFWRIRWFFWAPFVALSLVPTVGLFVPAVQQWDRGGPWSVALGASVIPTMAFALGLLVLHLRASEDRSERARTRLLLAGAVLGTSFGLVDLLSNLVHDIPTNLGALGFLGACALTLVAATRARLLESDFTLESIAIALALATACVVAYVVLFLFAGSRIPLMVLGVALVTLIFGAMVRRLAHRAAVERARTLEFATLGRFAAQMAHDFKNPLAALKGAAQYLEQDLRPEERQLRRGKFVGLMLEQIQRMEETIALYQRQARVEPIVAPVQINDVVTDALALEEFAAGDRISLLAELPEALPACNADRTLLDNALQNLLRNACEAIEGSGSVTVSTGLCPGSVQPAVFIRVADTGVGMDARTRERAFDEFFTTKPRGSGLGLSFVRRVAEAHGGAVSIDSQVGRGTVVSLLLPLESEER